MAVTLVAQVVAQLVGVPGDLPQDVESDSTNAAQGTLNVHIPSTAGTHAFIVIEPIAGSILSGLSNGPCTVVISQGAGSGTYTATA